jgi:hypothetical protein
VSNTNPPAPEPVPTEKKIIGLTLGDALKIGIPVIMGLIGIGLTYWINNKSPHLAVVVPAPVQFVGDKSKFGIITFSVTNDGSKKATNIVCLFKTQGAKTVDIKATPAILEPITTIKDETVSIKVASLNPGERLDVIAHIPDVLPTQPDLSVRGDDVNGEEQPKQTLGQVVAVTIVTTVAMLVLFGIFMIATNQLKTTAATQTPSSQQPIPPTDKTP